jgi:hypothetical protein
MFRRRVATGKAVPTVEEPLENLFAKFAVPKLLISSYYLSKFEEG